MERAKKDVNLFGYTAFRVEQQHEISHATGAFLVDVWDESVHMIAPFTVPKGWYIDRSFDWGTARPWCCIWWAESDGSPYTHPYNRGVGVYSCWAPSFAIYEEYGWRPGEPNIGNRDTNRDMAIKIRNTGGISCLG